ncbi:dihydroneopterin aldolase [Rhodobium gokarnense]|uniref:Dihydroneopterin aldolase n=1 Tax=Rhodobium gokarnense TaxID=364296 RepID=A0ABT3H5X5_9HYPH|nr:dihydroneopterin aldolase [Rhodobium gokarnense]MCW2305771.1 dihydroneopterin aldolase [Rhodobium gokarnense]
MTTPRVMLFLEDFEVTIDIGIHDHEIGTPQRVLINVDIEVDAVVDGTRGDEIDHVLDYDFIRGGIHGLVESRRYNLQETLCRDILAMLFSRPEVLAATVSTRKLDVYPDCKSVGCRMDARR